jgi:hypothetical protein
MDSGATLPLASVSRCSTIGGLIWLVSSPDGTTAGYDIDVGSGANRLTVAAGRPSG